MLFRSGLALLGQGHTDAAVRLLEQVLTTHRDAGDPLEEATSLCALAQVDLHGGNAARAIDRCVAAERLCIEADAEWALPSVLRVLGAAQADLGSAEAAETLMRARDLADTYLQAERGFVLAELVRLSERQGDAQQAAELQEQSTRALERLGFIGSARYPRRA